MAVKEIAGDAVLFAQQIEPTAQQLAIAEQKSCLFVLKYYNKYCEKYYNKLQLIIFAVI